MSKTYITDFDALTASLEGVQSSRMTRTMSADEATKAFKSAIAFLDSIKFPENARKDVRIVLDLSSNRQPSVNAYKYHASATVIAVRKNTVGWYLEEVERLGASSDSCINSKDYRIEVLSDSAFEKLQDCLLTASAVIYKAS